MNSISIIDAREKKINLKIKHIDFIGKNISEDGVVFGLFMKHDAFYEVHEKHNSFETLSYLDFLYEEL